MKLRKVLSAVAAAAVATSALAVAASAASYNGYIGFQTNNYSFRNAWDDGSYGKATAYYNSYIVWANNEETPEESYPGYDDYFDYDLGGTGGYALPATYVDAAITADGTYTVEAKDLAWDIRGDTDFNLAFLSTDIPANIGVAITNATIYVDGTAVKTIDAVEYNTEANYVTFEFANAWNPDLGSLGAYPTESLKIEFTVSGLGGDTATEAPATGDVDATTDSTKGSPDTGVADVAAVAGLAVLAGGAFIVAKKRK